MDKVFIDGLSFAAPLFVMAMGGIYSEKSGITNLAVEGFQGFGAFVGALIAVLLMPILGDGSQGVIYIAMLAAFIGGGLYACIHALLCIKFRANQVISGVVVNILAVALTTFLTSTVNKALTGGQSSNKFILGVSDRFTIPVLSDIPVLGALFQNMYPFEFVILGLAILAWYLMYKTRFGMHLRACGENPQAVDAAGGNVGRTRFLAVMISGALSGVGGICYAYSISANFSPNIYMGYGYLAIAAMIFGNWNILPTAAVCLFFGLAKSGGYQLCLSMGLSSNYSDLFMMLPYILTLILLTFFSKKNHPPKAAGEVYDKGKR
ncbi:ABC transporter permease [Oscillibacter sp. MSJ-2]|uniref:ABC transporter permease n=1 Tax=Dysosmobacter acutus TaxID=2841504 RepID=A0ABS6F8G8_9FIRM|nr:ABC transporter permease [Dysosmobacter acutus]MBU5626579.1 ABC transporter permease [Dysosmobacter acutus]